LMASCVGNFCAKNYQNLIIGFHVTVENVGDVFFGTPCSSTSYSNSQLRKPALLRILNDTGYWIQ